MKLALSEEKIMKKINSSATTFYLWSILRQLLIIILLSFLPLSQVLAANYSWYFSQSEGNDSTGDGSQGTPWQTMSKVQRQINTTSYGDVVNIYLKKGDTWTFGDANPLLSFGATKGTITLTAYGSGELPILDGEIDFTNLPDPIGGRMFYDKVIWIHKPNCTIEYIDIKRMYGGAINLVSGSDGATIQYCNFHDWGSNCIGGDPGANLANITVQYCSIYTGEQLCRYGELAYSSHGAAVAMIFGNHDPSNLYQHNLIYDIYGEGLNINRGIAQYNIIYNTKSTGILMTTGEGNYDGGDVTARWNLIFGTTSATYNAKVRDGRNFNGSGITVQDENSRGDNTTYDGKIYENIVIGRLYGIWIYNNQADSSNKMGSVKAYNNLLIDNNRNITLGGQEAELGFSDIDVHNNLSIKYDLTGGTGEHASDWIAGGLTNPAVSITYNHFWTTGGSPKVNSGFRTNYVVTDPKLPGETKGSPVNWDGLTAPSDLDFDTDFDTPSLPLQVKTWGIGDIIRSPTNLKMTISN
jgi:hypothetical protein